MTDGATQSIELEQAVLGAMLFDNRVVWDCADLRADHFSDPVHGFIFENIGKLMESGSRVSAASLSPFLRQSEAFADLDCDQYLTAITSAVPTTSGAGDYAKVVMELATARALQSYGQEVVGRASALSLDERSDGVLEFAEDALHNIAQSGTAREKVLSSAEQVDGFLDELSAKCRGEIDPGLTTGIPALDERIGGLRAGNLYIVAGRPGMGKTIAACRAVNAAIDAGVGVYFASLEMSHRECLSRLVADRCFDPLRVRYSSIDKGALSMTDQEAVAMHANDLRTPDLRLDDRGGLSAGQVVTAVRRHKRALERRGKRLGLVVVDYMGLLAMDRAFANSPSFAEGEKSKAMKALAKDLDVPVLGVCQLNREAENRTGNRPQMSDLRQTGQYEQDASLVALLFRPEYYLDQAPESDPSHKQHADWLEMRQRAAGRLDIISGKNRQGAAGTDQVFVDAGCSAIRGTAPGWWRS